MASIDSPPKTIINEVLCFLQNAFNSFTKDQIEAAIVDFYDADVVDFVLFLVFDRLSAAVDADEIGDARLGEDVTRDVHDEDEEEEDEDDHAG